MYQSISKVASYFQSFTIYVSLHTHSLITDAASNHFHRPFQLHQAQSRDSQLNFSAVQTI